MRASRRWLRIALVLLAFVLAPVLVSTFDLQSHFELEAIQSTIRGAGWWGMLVFVLMFSVGELLHIPGIVFVAASMLVYDRFLGTLIAYAGAVMAVTVSFLVVRTLGGQVLGTLEQPWVRRALLRLDQRPIRTVILLRIVLWMLPALNYALALTRIRLFHYVLGSALGLLPPIVLISLLFDWFLERLS
ncbi:MAG: VTT domain-containing protein [Myxococcota bacterium]